MSIYLHIFPFVIYFLKVDEVYLSSRNNILIIRNKMQVLARFVLKVIHYNYKKKIVMCYHYVTRNVLEI